MSSGAHRVGVEREVRAAAACLALCVVWVANAALADGVPIAELAWAYAVDASAGTPATPAATPARAVTPPPGATPAPALEEARYSLPGAASSFTLADIANRYGPADWYPSDHPPMPRIVAAGRVEAGIWACGLCHYPNGKGRPENAALAGLPKGYIVQQLHDFAAGLRGSAEPRKTNTALMIGFARAMTEDEIDEAAAYFSSMPWTPWIEVVETDSVPKTRVSGGMHLRLDGPDAAAEPIGRRIIETPRDTEHTERLRDPRSDFIAYVPKGSIEKGKNLATTGGTTTTACVICHGPDLNGLALVPPLRGRSPSYIARQLYDFQRGARHGTWAPLMAAVVERLTGEDIVDLSAYIASLPVEPETTARQGAP